MTQRVYAYEVTMSSLPQVTVGGCLIDREWEPSPGRTWHLWNERTDEFTVGYAGVRRERICLTCYDLSERQVRVHGHDGKHGPGPGYRPPWVATPEEILAAKAADDRIEIERLGP